jgi:hypothetical protein
LSGLGERRHHLAGLLGNLLLLRFTALGWGRRLPDSRVFAFSAGGEQALRQWLDSALTAKTTRMLPQAVV